jgi:hypothetical protein
MPGTATSAAEVTNISQLGLWILVDEDVPDGVELRWRSGCDVTTW